MNVNEGLELAEASRYEWEIGMVLETERNLGGHGMQG